MMAERNENDLRGAGLFTQHYHMCIINDIYQSFIIIYYTNYNSFSEGCTEAEEYHFLSHYWLYLISVYCIQSF